jgi:hypothetical protein
MPQTFYNDFFIHSKNTKIYIYFNEIIENISYWDKKINICNIIYKLS